MRDQELDQLFVAYRTSGDVAALGELFDRVAPELLRVGRHFGGGTHAAEDLVQATFLTAIERALEFDAEREVVPWLVGILARHAANARRKRGRELDADRIAPNKSRDLAPDASALAEERELREELGRAVGSLSPTYRDALAAFLVEGLRPHEIAERLGLSPGAARVRVHRGLELLRRALPAGFAAGAAVSITTGRGLAAVRADVLSQAAHAAPSLAASTAVSASAMTWIGGLLVTQRIVIVCAAALAVVAGIVWTVVPREAVVRIASAPSAALARGPESASTPAALPAPTGGETAMAAVDGAARREVASGATDVDAAEYTALVTDALSKLPIAGARAWTTPRGASARVLRGESNGDGELRFRAPLTEREMLRIDADGYAPWFAPVAGAREPVLDTRASAPRARDPALGEIALLPGIELEGRVVDAHGAPVSGAELSLCSAEDDQLEPIGDRALGSTDDDGRMVFDGLLPRIVDRDAAHYVVFAVHDAGVGWARAADAGERDEVDPITIVLDAGVRLEMRVRDDSGAPVVGARVTCLPAQRPFSRFLLPEWGPRAAPLHPAWSRVLSADTDTRGVAVFAHLMRPPDDETRGLGCRYLFDVSLDGSCVWRGTREIACAGTAVIELEVAREPAWSLCGRVIDESGAPMEGVRVEMLDTERSAVTATDGSYALAMRPDDRLRVEISAAAPGYRQASATIDRTAFRFQLDGHDLVLRRPLSISGRIVDRAGAPLAGVLVRGHGPDRITSDTPPERSSDRDGRFVLDDASAGEWELFVYAPPELDVVSVGRHWSVRGGDRDVEIVLEKNARGEVQLVLDVVDADTGAALDVLRATVFAAGSRLPMSSDYVRWSNATIEIEELAPGRYDVWVAAAGHADGFAVLDVADRPPVQRVRLAVGRAASVIGRVDRSRAPAGADLTVTATLRNEARSSPGNAEYFQHSVSGASARTGADGAFEMAGLMPGPWSFTVRGEGVRGAPVLRDLVSGEASEVLLVADPAALVDFAPDAGLPACWVIAQFSIDGEAWTDPWTFRPRRDDARAPMRFTVDPGNVRWRVQFVRSPGAERSELLCETQEGAVEIGAGERKTVSLRVVPIAK